MRLDSLHIINLRNLDSVEFQLNSQFNVFWGKNGSGKTSLLEAINLLTTGRSFRTSKSGQMIKFGEKSCVVSGVVSAKTAQPLQDLQNFPNGNEVRNTNYPIRLGIERFSTGAPKIRLAEQDCQSIVQLTRVLPIQLINTDSYDILEANPQIRRQFLDWLMFHVEHSFYGIWQRFKRALAQRNAALKNCNPFRMPDIQIWDKELVETGEALDKMRGQMLEHFIPVFLEILDALLMLKGKVNIHYCRGWDENIGFTEALQRSFSRDREWGYTTVGPQRADLEFNVGNLPAKSILSRGQLKLFVCALLTARATLLYRKCGRQCVFLVDDLNSELDKEANESLAQALYEWGGQVLVTSIENASLAKLLEKKEHTLFHVEQGRISMM
jgi:DNA replication and repair protein RecF